MGRAPVGGSKISFKNLFDCDTQKGGRGLRIE